MKSSLSKRDGFIDRLYPPHQPHLFQPDRAMNYGMTSQTKKATRMLLLVGQRKTMSHFTDIKIM